MAAALLCLLATLGAVGGLPEIVKIGEECYDITLKKIITNTITNTTINT